MSASRTLAADTTLSADLDLVDRHRYGDGAAFEEIYQLHSSMVYALCVRMSGNPTAAQDLSQEVFLRIFRSLGGFRGRSSLRTWIYRITLNHCRSRLGRKRLLTKPLETSSVDGEVRDPSRGPEDIAISHDAGRVVSAALLHLPARFREAVVLRDIEGLSYREIASVLGVRVGTVRSRIARGRDRLRVLMEAGHE